MSQEQQDVEERAARKAQERLVGRGWDTLTESLRPVDDLDYKVLELVIRRRDVVKITRWSPNQQEWLNLGDRT